MFKGLVEKIGRPIMLQELVKKQKGGQQLSVLCQLYSIHSICWHLPPEKSFIIAVFEIIICFQLFVCLSGWVCFSCEFHLKQTHNSLLLLSSVGSCTHRNNTLPQGFARGQTKHCQRHKGPEGWVQITSSYTNLDRISSSESRPSVKQTSASRQNLNFKTLTKSSFRFSTKI